MNLGCRLRITLAAAIAAVGGGSIVAASTVEAGGPELLPDLETVKPLDSGSMYLLVKKHHTILRLSNRIGNSGDGPLELFAGPVDEACPDEFAGPEVEADQRIFANTNGELGFQRGEDAQSRVEKVGCFEYHPAHGHWHFQDFSQYKLVDAGTDELVAGPSKKIGFCIVDNFPPAFPGPDVPEEGYYPQGGCGFGQPNPDVGPGTMGLSVGYADTYTASTPGQRLDVTDADRGRYCLVSTANPDHTPDADPSQLIESDPDNNARRTLIKLNPAKEKVHTLDGSCAAALKR